MKRQAHGLPTCDRARHSTACECHGLGLQNPGRSADSDLVLLECTPKVSAIKWCRTVYSANGHRGRCMFCSTAFFRSAQHWDPIHCEVPRLSGGEGCGTATLDHKTLAIASHRSRGGRTAAVCRGRNYSGNSESSSRGLSSSPSGHLRRCTR